MNAREQYLQKQNARLQEQLKTVLALSEAVVDRAEYEASVACGFAWDLVHATDTSRVHSDSAANAYENVLYDMETEWAAAVKAGALLPPDALGLRNRLLARVAPVHEEGGPQVNGDLMSLVDELHALRNENAVLRAQIAEQSVRIDEMLEQPMTHGLKTNLRWASVTVDHMEMLMHANQGRVPLLLADRLSKILVAEIPRIAQRVEAFDKDSLAYHFAFISLGGIK